MLLPTLRAARAPMLLLLTALLTACASTSPAWRASVPPLPPSARQEPSPALCLPSCSAGWKRLVESLQQTPTAPASPASSASAATTR